MALQDVLLPPVRNRLLAALPIQIFARLWPHLKSVELVQGQELMSIGQPISAVYFPETGYAAVIAQPINGVSAETCLIGREGLIGASLLSGNAVGTLDVVVHGSGSMLCMEATPFGRALDHVPGLKQFLVRYAVAFRDQVVEDMACNSQYTSGQRLAYRVLLLRDHHGCDGFPVTVDALASMLGVGVSEVTSSMARARQAGLIDHRQGRLTILDPSGLEEVACGCHQARRGRFAELLGPATRSARTV